MLDVYLIHGLYMNRYALAPLARDVRAAGHHTTLVGHHTIMGSLSRSADHLAECIRHGDEKRRRVIVGHSLGGVVAAYAASRFEDLHVDDVILLGSPFHGSAAARGLAMLPGGLHLVGGPLREWMALENFAPRRGLRLWTLIGNRQLGIGQYIGHFAHLPSDGTVALHEARIDGAHASAMLPVSHLQMLVSQPVTTQVLEWLGKIDSAKQP
ncbi:MAG: alpha/beta hydrolase [Rhodocyclaceae bacterium]